MRRYSLTLALALIVAVSGIAYAAGVIDGDENAELFEAESGPPLDLESAYLAALESNPDAVDAVGALTTFRTKHVPGRAFGFEHGNSAGSSTGCAYRTTTGNSLLSATVELPIGAVVTSFSAHIRDTDAGGGENVQVNLVRTTQAGTDTPVASNLGTATSSGSSGPAEYSATVNATVGQNEFWYLEAVGTDSNEQVCGVEIFYNVPAEYAELVLTPLTPCVVYDSRPGQGGEGKFAANETRTVNFIGETTDLSGQGGSATGCGVPDLVGIGGTCIFVCEKPVKAVAMNIVAINPDSGGQAKMWPSDESEPTQGALVNYIPGGNNSNATIVAIGQCTGFLPSVCADDIDIKSGSNGSHIRLVVTGYFTHSVHIEG